MFLIENEGFEGYEADRDAGSSRGGGVSAKQHRVAFPWGCGQVPLPDGPSFYAVTHGSAPLAVVYGDTGSVFFAPPLQ